MQMLNRSSTNRVASGSKPGFLDKAKAGIAHTSTIPGMGNRELRELQTLINEEKSVLTAHDKLSTDTGKAATALAAWGNSEGQDLSDVLTKAGDMLGLLSVSIGRFSERQKDIRGVFKSVRTSEETLEETKKRRRAVGSRSEREEKKLVKMSAENKNLPAQTELLQSLRNEMRELDTEIMNEEAKLSDFKRLATKEALGIKFGALLELSEKATIVGELGKLLIEEIPLDTTPPGYGRAPYDGFDRTARLASEAQKCTEEVIYTAPSVELIPHTASSNPFQAQAEGSSSAHPAGEDGRSPREYVDFGDEPELPLRLRHEESNGALSQTNNSQYANLNNHNTVTPSVPSSFAAGRSRVVLGADGNELPRSRESSQGRDGGPVSPAMAYRQSFHGPSEPTPLTRDDGYGNEIPFGEADEDVPVDHYNAPSPALQSPGLSGGGPNSRPRVGGPRLSLGLGNPQGSFLGGAGGGLQSPKLPVVGTPTSSRPPQLGEPITTSSIPPPPESPADDESFLPYAAPHQPQSASVSTPPVSGAGPGSYIRRTSNSSAIQHSNGHGALDPPSAPFASSREMGNSPMSEGERESYVDAPEVMPRQESAAGPAGNQYPQYSYSYDPSSPTTHAAPAPAAAAHSSIPLLASPSPYSTTTTASTLPLHPHAPHIPYSTAPATPRDEHALATAAAQREVEREMDSLAYSSASPSSNPESYAPKEAGRKMAAGAFFKQRGASRSAFVPPPETGEVGDRGVSEDEGAVGGGTQPLNLGRKARRSVEGEAAPPYMG